jgi:hypothetical protein
MWKWGGVGDVVSVFFVRAFVWGDIDPHGGGLDAGEPDGGAVVVEVISGVSESTVWYKTNRSHIPRLRANSSDFPKTSFQGESRP